MINDAIIPNINSLECNIIQLPQVKMVHKVRFKDDFCFLFGLCLLVHDCVYVQPILSLTRNNTPTVTGNTDYKFFPKKKTACFHNLSIYSRTLDPQ